MVRVRVHASDRRPRARDPVDPPTRPHARPLWGCDQDAVGSTLKTLDYDQRINTTRAWNSNDTDVRRIRDATGPCHIGSRVATPVTQVANDLGLEVYRHSVFTSARSCCSVNPLRFAAPDRHVATHKPHPLHKLSFTEATVRPSLRTWGSMALKGHTSAHARQPTHLIGYALISNFTLIAS